MYRTSLPACLSVLGGALDVVIALAATSLKAASIAPLRPWIPPKSSCPRGTLLEEIRGIVGEIPRQQDDQPRFIKTFQIGRIVELSTIDLDLRRQRTEFEHLQLRRHPL